MYRSSIFSLHSTCICFCVIPMATFLINIVQQYENVCIHKLAMYPHRHWCNSFMITLISPFIETGEVYEWIFRHWWHLSSKLKTHWQQINYNMAQNSLDTRGNILIIKCPSNFCATLYIKHRTIWSQITCNILAKDQNTIIAL